MPPIQSLLAQAFADGGSDLLIAVGSPPVVRRHGALARLDMPRLSPADTEALLGQVLNEEARRRFEAAGELSLTYSVFGSGRFRVSAMRQRGTVSLAVRSIPAGVPPAAQLGLPGAAVHLALAEQGLVLVAGPPGSGRTTTLAALVDTINAGRAAHVITVEQPVEFLHKHQQSLIVQREVGTDTATFVTGLESAVAHAPDVLVLSRLGPDVTMAALQFAAAGRLVLAAVTASTTSDAASLVVTGLPPHQQQPARRLLAGCLVGAVCQRLMPRADEAGRVAAFEVLVTGPAAREHLAAGSWPELGRLINEGREPGTIGMRQALAELAAVGSITQSTFLAHVNAFDIASG
jgi:twitching motility protein PilT